jgi:hypothetical protein
VIARINCRLTTRITCQRVLTLSEAGIALVAKELAK